MLISGTVNPAQLGIIARTSAMHYKNTSKRADEIARELGVRYLLETSLRRIGNRIRITAQLVDAESQSHVWVQQYEREATDLLALEGEVAAAVARRTMSSLGLTRIDLDSGTLRLSNNSLTYEHYLRGRYHQGRAAPRNYIRRRSTFAKPSNSIPLTRGRTAAWPTLTRCWAATTSCRSASPTRLDDRRP